MNYIDEIFVRANIQQIREFLLHGTEENNIDPRTYIERLESVQDKLYERLLKDYPNETELDEIIDLICDFIIKTQDVYTEIGLQAGVAIAAQIAQNLKTAFEGDVRQG